MSFARRQQDAREAQGLEDTPEFHLRVYRSWDELANLTPAWERLLENSVGPTIFSTPEWLGAWWKAYGQGKQLLALAFWNTHGELIGLAPFYIEKLRGGIRRLRLIGDGSVRGDGSCDSDNLDLIFRSGQEEVCSQALLEWLGTHALWYLCELNRLPTDSRSARNVLADLRRRKWPHATSVRPSLAIQLPGSWESYLRQIPHEHAGGIERYTRRLHRRYAVSIFKCTKEEELTSYLVRLFDLHQRRWTSQGVRGSFALVERRRFYANISKTFLRRGWLEFWLLELNGKTAAAQFAFRYGDTVFQLQEGLDPTYYSDRVGHVLRAHVIRQLISEGVRCYDYLGGDDAHKRNWGARPGSYIDIHFTATRFSTAHLYVQSLEASHAVGRWLRENAPSTYSRLWDIYLELTRHSSRQLATMRKSSLVSRPKADEPGAR